MYYLIVGATCAGKDKIANYMVDNFDNIKMMISTTSRPIRPKEKNGVEYYFVSSDEFKNLIEKDALVEYRIYETLVDGKKDMWYYGLEKDKISDGHSSYVVVMDYSGALEFMNYFGRNNCKLIYVKSPYSHRYVRNILRGDFNLQEWSRRNKDDEKWLIEACNDADVVIENFGFQYPPNPMNIDPMCSDNNVDIVEGLDTTDIERTFNDTIQDINFLHTFFEKQS
jgi:guanylate kinase